MKSSTIIPLFLGVFVLLAVGYFITIEPPKASEPENTAEQPAQEEQAQNDSSIVPMTEEETQTALSERILGDVNAPIRISEHASLTCGHCGQFHKNTFDQVKKEYIDTGKAYFVFSDFPLNGAALHATMTARCLPEDKYFDYISMLFKNQDAWAFSRNYITYLKKSAENFGLSATKFESCLNNEALQKGIVERMKASSEQWDIKSTPSFVINNKVTITGAYPYDAFKEKLEEASTGNVQVGTLEE